VLGPTFTSGKQDAPAISFFSVPAAEGGGHGKERGKMIKDGPCEPVLKHGPNTFGGNARKRAWFSPALWIIIASKDVCNNEGSALGAREYIEPRARSNGP
jgi:hypothetical protein